MGLNIALNMTELIGKTPLVRLDRYAALAPAAGGRAAAGPADQAAAGAGPAGAAGIAATGPAGPPATILAKLELSNPGSSVKDRIALGMIEAAEGSGALRSGATIIEPTSGNTGIGLAWIAAARGYPVILVMPESMSLERRKVLQFLGAQIVLTPAREGMGGAIRKAETLLAHTPGAFMPQQFNNPANPAVHYRTTGPEIWEATAGRVDILVAGVGTGGTLSGTGRYLKERNPAIQVVAVEPESSPVISGGPAGPHLIQGIGAGFVPANLDRSLLDRIIRVHSQDAIQAGKDLAKSEGIMGGISSGANVFAARLLAREPANAGKTIVTVICDTAERYVSTLLFHED